jgi:hypothetical protein
MLRHGIPEDVVAALQSVSRAFRASSNPLMRADKIHRLIEERPRTAY